MMFVVFQGVVVFLKMFVDNRVDDALSGKASFTWWQLVPSWLTGLLLLKIMGETLNSNTLSKFR